MHINHIAFLFILLVLIGVVVVTLNRANNAVVLIAGGLMVVASPVIGIYWLLITTVLFVYKGHYKAIFIIWGWFFFSWYILFTACLIGFEFPILIGGAEKPEQTFGVFLYILDDPTSAYFFSNVFGTILRGFCIQTYLILSLLSVKLGIPIWVPSVFKGLWGLFEVVCKFFFGGGGKGGTAGCSPEKASGSKPSSGNGWSFKKIFGGKGRSKPSPEKGPENPFREPEASPIPSPENPWVLKDFWKSSQIPISPPKREDIPAEDFSRDCNFLREEYLKTKYPGQWWGTREVVRGAGKVSYTEASIPYWNFLQFCYRRNATPADLEYSKKKGEEK